jgi:hypothetical protein
LWAKPRAYSSGELLSGARLRQVPALLTNIRLRLERLDMDKPYLTRAKHSKLLQKHINDGCKKFYSTGLRRKLGSVEHSNLFRIVFSKGENRFSSKKWPVL